MTPPWQTTATVSPGWALHDLAETAQYPALECWSLVLVKQSDGFVACHAGEGGGGGELPSS